MFKKINQCVMQIIVAATDPVIASALTELLASQGYTCTQAASRAECEKTMESALPQALVYDASALPELDEFPLPRLGIGLGLPRPVRAFALLARLQAQVTLPLADGWVLSAAKRALKRAGMEDVELTEKEAALLARLLESPERTLSRQALLEAVWGYGDGIDTHTLETHMYRLRGKLKDALGSTDLIAATPTGYKINV